MKTQKTILVAPLNWGLGHATRCMPVIDELLKQGASVVLASDGGALQLLEKAYPKLPTIALPSYGVTYKGSNMFINMAPQLPKILRAIKLERQKLFSIIEEYQIDAIIADNRYGCYHPNVQTVFMTHQLHIQLPQNLIQSIVNRLNHQLVQKFDACWVPDWEQEPTLAGILAHPPIAMPLKYTGPLSRFIAYREQQVTKKYDVIVVLSGPEPQRSILEQKILKQVQEIQLKFLIIGGQLEGNAPFRLPISKYKHIERKAFLQAAELAKAIQESEVVVVRSGYSTLMDLIALQCRKVLLIPTPGQTEQEYLATHFEQQFGYATTTQKKLNLKQDLSAVITSKVDFGALPYFEYQLAELVEDLLSENV